MTYNAFQYTKYDNAAICFVGFLLIYIIVKDLLYGLALYNIIHIECTFYNIADISDLVQIDNPSITFFIALVG